MPSKWQFGTEDYLLFARENFMTERVWDKFLTEEDKAVFKASGLGARSGYGERPAVLVIDVSYGSNAQNLGQSDTDH